jgi:rhodanese-related sulfurtransferase
LKLLGLQAVGKGDICRRIDVFSSFLQKDSTVYDLIEFEHGYAPPYAEALDPLHNLAGVALAQERGIEFVGPGFDFCSMDADTSCLDVREADEVKAQSVEQLVSEKGQSMHIPLNELVEQISKLDSKKKMVILCRRGPRSYQAALILKAAGFENVQVIAGGTTALVTDE